MRKKNSAAIKPWLNGGVETPAGPVPRVTSRLSFTDIFGTVCVRLGLRRMKYTVPPGIYAVGKPGSESPVFVSANYKLSFDRLRRSLDGIDGWILVIDTKGVNVWCAAGKGTFGTEEICGRIESTGLAGIVSHRMIILPQLGAPGAAAQTIRSRSSFKVIFGPVRAADIPAFIASGLKASPEMRTVRFSIADRAVLIPLELVMGGGYILAASLIFFFLSGLSRSGYMFPGQSGLRQALLLFVSFLTGGALVPLLLPWIPGRALSFKGMFAGLLLASVLILTGFIDNSGAAGQLEMASWLFLMPAVSAFFAMNFTGATTYTSLSGVKKEIRIALPAIVSASLAGSVLWLVSRFLQAV